MSPLAVLAAVVLGLAVALLAIGPRAWRLVVARRLHDRLAAANGLDDAESRWLWQLAGREVPGRRAAVFVRPSLLPADGGERARTIRRKLFGDS